MFCSKCGANNKDGVKFCTSCGEPVGQNAEVVRVAAPERPAEVVRVVAPTAVEVEAEPKKNKASMILGIVATALGGTALCSLFAGFAYAIGGIICACIGRNKGDNPHRLTTVGLWLSIGGVVSSFIWLILYIVYIFALVSYY